MSEITTVLLSPGGWEEDADVVAALNARLRELGPEPPDRWALRNIATRDHAWGGTKWPPALYGGALNHLPFDEFARIAGELPWSEPELFQLFVMTQEEDRYRVFTLADLRVWTAG
ncbi:hypothetical protein ACGFZP_35995 [Kitasatospora sp. NPDC048239]|uniref:hypothetical protein n=1 Tax=Kitasatospora sp. NPDC048239 TaxID=3364046 RepID=UPI003720811A